MEKCIYFNLDTQPLNNKQILIMDTLVDFYDDIDIIKKICPILQGNTKLSLRIIDWFVTNYSKKNNVTYPINIIKGKKESQIEFIVYLDYKNKLKAYSKKQFDPFCRRERIKFVYNRETSEYLITTVGQLNFFRWALENKIIDYIEQNLGTIDKDMNENIRKPYKSKRKTKSKKMKENVVGSVKIERRKRRELSKAATKTLNRYKCNITLDFD